MRALFAFVLLMFSFVSARADVLTEQVPVFFYYGPEREVHFDLTGMIGPYGREPVVSHESLTDIVVPREGKYALCLASVVRHAEGYSYLFYISGVVHGGAQGWMLIGRRAFNSTEMKIVARMYVATPENAEMVHSAVVQQKSVQIVGVRMPPHFAHESFTANDATVAVQGVREYLDRHAQLGRR